MKMMTKNEFTKFALIRGISVGYSGKTGKFTLRKIFNMDIHAVINSKIK